jgi:hypothetical protein
MGPTVMHVVIGMKRTCAHEQVKPCGAVEWEAVANRLGRWSKGGASAERMFRTLADPQYQKTSNRCV